MYEEYVCHRRTKDDEFGTAVSLPYPLNREDRDPYHRGDNWWVEDISYDHRILYANRGDVQGYTVRYSLGIHKSIDFAGLGPGMVDCLLGKKAILGITKEPCDANYDHGLGVGDLVVMLNNWEQADPYDPPFVRTRDLWFIETARRLWNGRALEGRCELDQWRHACIDAGVDSTGSAGSLQAGSGQADSTSSPQAAIKELRFELSGPGDMDLYVTSGTHSRSTRWDLKSDGPTGRETIVVDGTTNPPAGPARWFVAVHGVQASDFVLTATVTTVSGSEFRVSGLEEAVSGLGSRSLSPRGTGENVKCKMRNEKPIMGEGGALSLRGTRENEQLAMSNKQLATEERNSELKTRNSKLETARATMTIRDGSGRRGGRGTVGVSLTGQGAKTVAINATVLYDSAILTSPTVRTAGIASGHRIKTWEKRPGELHFLIFSDIPTPLGGMAGESVKIVGSGQWTVDRRNQEGRQDDEPAGPLRLAQGRRLEEEGDEIARIEFRVASSATSGTQTLVRLSDVFPNDTDYDGVRGTALGDYDGKSTTPTLVDGTFTVVEPPPGVVSSYWQAY